jgi:SpoVK/Ycf46/Vps4 family AAA+-type ATPase
MKTELLVQLDGLARQPGERVFVLVGRLRRGPRCGYPIHLQPRACRNWTPALPSALTFCARCPLPRQAATNMPWELDTVRGVGRQGLLCAHAAGERVKPPLTAHAAACPLCLPSPSQALLRRLEKRIPVPLPPLAARRGILQSLLADCLEGAEPTASGGPSSGPGSGSGRHTTAAAGAAQQQQQQQQQPALHPGVSSGGAEAAEALDAVAAATEGYSGSDLASLAKEAAMRPLRRLLAQLDASGGASGGRGGGGGGATAAVGPVTAGDLRAALAATRPSAARDAARYEAFVQRFGQGL